MTKKKAKSKKRSTKRQGCISIIVKNMTIEHTAHKNVTYGAPRENFAKSALVDLKIQI